MFIKNCINYLAKKNKSDIMFLLRGDMMNSNITGAVLAFAIGAVICFAGFKLSQYFIKKHPDKLSSASMLKQVFQVLYIVLLFFLSGYTPWDRTYLLVGGALGITLPMLIFTALLLKVNKSSSDNNDEKEAKNDG